MCDVRSASFFKFSVCDMGQRKGDLLSVMLISKLELLVINIVLVTKCQLMCQNHIFYFLQPCCEAIPQHHPLWRALHRRRLRSGI